MPDELPVNDAAQIPQELSAAPQQDEFLSTFRSLVDGLPDDMSRDDLVKNVLDWQDRASRAEQLEAELNQFRADRASAAAELANKPAPQAPVVATEDDFKLPWNLTKVDPSLEGLCKVDAETGMYVAKNEFSATHQKAAEEMNQHAMQARQFIHALTTDPVGTAEILTKKQLAAMKKEFAAELAEFKSQFAPIQQRAEEDRRATEINSFAASKEKELFVDGGAFTPVGQLMDEFLRDGLAPQAAYDKSVKLAKTMNLGLPTPAQEPAPSLTPPDQAKKNQRFIDKLSSRSRLPVDRPEFDEGPKRNFTAADMKKKYGITNNAN